MYLLLVSDSLFLITKLPFKVWEPYVVLRWCPTKKSIMNHSSLDPVKPLAPYWDER